MVKGRGGKLVGEKRRKKESWKDRERVGWEVVAGGLELVG